MAAKAMATDHHILDCGHAGKHPRRLEGADQAEASDPYRRQARKVAARKADFPSIARHDVGDEVEDGGLAGAVRTDQRGDLMWLRIERHVVDRFETAKAFDQAAHAQDRAFNWVGLRVDRRHDARTSVLIAFAFVGIAACGRTSRVRIWINAP